MPFEELLSLQAHLIRQLKHGENPQQQGAMYALPEMPGYEDPLALGKYLLVNSNIDPSFINVTDFGRALRAVIYTIAALKSNPYGHDRYRYVAAAVKHGNVCGLGADVVPSCAITKMIYGDRIAVHGAVIATNFEITQGIAELLLHEGMKDNERRLIDGVAAPEFDPHAAEMLRRIGSKCPLLMNEALSSIDQHSIETSPTYVSVRGVLLAQTPSPFIPMFRPGGSGTLVKRHGTPPGLEIERDLCLAWAVGSSSTSNTITLASEGTILSNGVGQQDRVWAVHNALGRAERSGYNTTGSVAYSDSFFSHTDAVVKLIEEVRVHAIFATMPQTNPARNEEVVKLCTDAGVTLYTIPDKIGRGFYGHC